MNFNSKSGRKRCFSYETKASISFIPMRRMYLWCLITKSKEIIMWIRVCPNRRTNVNSRNGTKRSFSDETKASIPFIPMKRTCLWCLTIERKDIIKWIHVYPNWKMNFNCKNGRKRSICYETKASIHLSPRGEWICGAQSLKERRSIGESGFIQLKNGL